MEISIKELHELETAGLFYYWITAIACIVLFLVARFKESYSLPKALAVAVLPAAIFLILMQSEQDIWYKANINEGKIILEFADSHSLYLSASHVTSVQPRYGRNRCAIIIRAGDEAFKSASMKNEKCREAAEQLYTQLGL